MLHFNLTNNINNLCQNFLANNMGKPILYQQTLNPPSRSVIFVANALNLELEEKYVNLVAGEHLKPEFTKINPQQKIPTHDDNGHIIWESNAIIIYLVEKYGKNDSLYPKDPAIRSTINQRIFFNVGVLIPALRACTRPILYGDEALPEEEHINGIKNALTLLNALFRGNKFLVGDTITLADYAIITSATQCETFTKIDETVYPHIYPWIKRVQEQTKHFDLNIKGVNQFKEAVANKMKINSTKK